MQSYVKELKKNDVLNVAGDRDNDLYWIDKGTLLVCAVHGSEIIKIAEIGAGEFVGELSFFDGKERSAAIIALEKSKLIQFPSIEITPKLPEWYRSLCKGMTRKIRLLDEVVKKKRIKKSNVDSLTPLSIEEQRYFFEILKPHLKTQDTNQ